MRPESSLRRLKNSFFLAALKFFVTESVNSVAPLFESGMIWAPLDKQFAQEVVEECAAFPYGDHDDLVDSTTQAIMRFRQGGLINHPEDYRDERLPRRKYKYYW